MIIINKLLWVSKNSFGLHCHLRESYLIPIIFKMLLSLRLFFSVSNIIQQIKEKVKTDSTKRSEVFIKTGKLVEEH